MRSKNVSMIVTRMAFIFFFSSRRRHTRCSRDWSSDVCSSDLFLFLVERSIRDDRLALSLGIREDVLDLRLLVVSEIQTVQRGLHFVVHSLFFTCGLRRISL